ncbi:hypothetical protein C8R43DRAFT_1142657 [Mycena crocata]|nr:hypothetical protein C8R43DRAFT_1142657 [Mycena crocata]
MTTQRNNTSAGATDRSRPPGPQSREPRELRSSSQSRGGGSSSRGLNTNHPTCPATSSVSTPTAASLARHASAPNTPAAPFGSNAPRVAAFNHFQQIAAQTPSRSAWGANVADMEAAPGSYRSGSAMSAASAPADTPRRPQRSPRHTPLPSSTAVTEAEPSPLSSLSTSAHSPLGGSRSQSLAASAAIGERTLPPHLEHESVTASLAQLRVGRSPSPEAERFFSGPGRSIELFKEPLSAAVDRYHAPYDLSDPEQYNPLLRFGAVDGILPGMDDSASILLRDTLMRFQRPHISFEWTSMSDVIDRARQIAPDSASILHVTEDTLKRWTRVQP